MIMETLRPGNFIAAMFKILRLRNFVAVKAIMIIHNKQGIVLLAFFSYVKLATISNRQRMGMGIIPSSYLYYVFGGIKNRNV
jgi:hypothetical protein